MCLALFLRLSAKETLRNLFFPSDLPYQQESLSFSQGLLINLPIFSSFPCFLSLAIAPVVPQSYFPLYLSSLPSSLPSFFIPSFPPRSSSFLPFSNLPSPPLFASLLLPFPSPLCLLSPLSPAPFPLSSRFSVAPSLLSPLPFFSPLPCTPLSSLLIPLL